MQGFGNVGGLVVVCRKSIFFKPKTLDDVWYLEQLAHMSFQFPWSFPPWADALPVTLMLAKRAWSWGAAVKFSNWTVLPWALCALAHPDYEEARAAAVYLCGSMWNLHTVQGDLAVQVQICWNIDRRAWMVLQPAKYSFHTNQNCGVLKLCWAYPAGCRPPALTRTHQN